MSVLPWLMRTWKASDWLPEAEPCGNCISLSAVKVIGSDFYNSKRITPYSCVLSLLFFFKDRVPCSSG